MGLGVVAKEFIHKNEYVTEYKYCKLYAEKERAEYEDEYDLNDEGCYIMDVKIKGRWHCLDATRRFKSYGRYSSSIIIMYLIYFITSNQLYMPLSRYINHALPGKANVKPHPVLFVNGKYRVGFYALRDICPGEELFWDYSYQKNAPNWLRRKKIERVCKI